MKRHFMFILFFALLNINCNAQKNYTFSKREIQPTTISTQSKIYDPIIQDKIQTIDCFLGIIPGAVQIRKERLGWASGMIAGTTGFAFLAISQNARINKANINADADPSNAVYYEGVKRNATQWRNIGLIGLGVTEIVNYVSAMILKDNSDAGLVSICVDPLGSIGLTYAFYL